MQGSPAGCEQHVNGLWCVVRYIVCGRRAQSEEEGVSATTPQALLRGTCWRRLARRFW